VGAQDRRYALLGDDEGLRPKLLQPERLDAGFWRIVEKHMTKEMDMDGNGKMNWFFNEWVYGTQIPNYKLDYRFEARRRR